MAQLVQLFAYKYDETECESPVPTEKFGHGHATYAN